MRTAPSDIDAMITSGLFTLCTCVKIALRDGTEIGFTDLDRSITVALDSDMGSSPVSYSATGMILGDLVFATGLDSDNGSLRVPIGDLVAREDVAGRRFNQASVYIFDINHQADSFVAVEVMKGWITDADVEEGEAVFEIRSLVDKFNSVIGSVITPRCRATFGDTKCGKIVSPVGCAITAMESNMRFTTDLSGYSDQEFRFGEVDFLTGALSNVWRFEVVQSSADGVIELFSPLPSIPQVGDTLHIYTGCSKLKKHSDPTIPTCFTNDNVERFRGFDRCPGSDTYVKIAIPGSSG